MDILLSPGAFWYRYFRYVEIKWYTELLNSNFAFHPRPVSGQYWPPGIVSACVHPSVSPSVNKFFFRTITQHPFMLGSPNFDHRCKIPWLRSVFCLFIYLFIFFFFWGGGGGDWLWPSSSNLSSKSKFIPFWACPRDNSSPGQARTTKLGPDVQVP